MSVSELSISADRIEPSIFEGYRPNLDKGIRLIDHFVLNSISFGMLLCGAVAWRISTLIAGIFLIAGVAVFVFSCDRYSDAISKAHSDKNIVDKELLESIRSILNSLKEQSYTPTFSTLSK